jgi:hypothetical protein
MELELIILTKEVIMSKTSQRKESTFAEGRWARRNNLSQKMNPYRKDKGIQTIWNAGWVHEDTLLKNTKETKQNG